MPAAPPESPQERQVLARADDRDRGENDEREDLDRDPRGDPDGDAIVWFDPDALAAASSIEIGSHAVEIDTLRVGPTREQIAERMASPDLHLAKLPGWPESGPSGQGWGDRLDAMIGPIRPGFVGLVGAATRGAGRTSWLAQLADGLALRESASIVTPAICLFEDDPSLFRARSLGRWAGVDPRHFLGPGGPDRTRDLALLDGEWRALTERQRFAPVERIGDPIELAKLAAAIERWRVEIRGARALEVWPVLVIDTLPTLAWVPRLAELAARHALIVFASVDTPEPVERSIDRHLGVRLQLHPAERSIELELAHVQIGQRGSVRIGWDRICGRFDADCEPD